MLKSTHNKYSVTEWVKKVDDESTSPHNRPKTTLGTKFKRKLLEFDAYVDDSVHVVASIGLDFLAHYNSAMDRFRVRGFRRVLSELGSETATWGVGGAVLALLLAQGAFEETSKDWLATDEFAITFLDRNGREIGKRGILLDDAVTLGEIPDHLIKATLATEDRRFYDHFGIDVLGTFRAMIENARAGGVVQGGSSITQQLAKNLFLSNERTLDRKIKEAFLALWLEVNLTKDEILKLYLDRAYMGGGAFGVAAASEYYFDKSVSTLTLAESAMLAGLYKAPTKYAPHRDLPAARARANEVLQNMVEANFLSDSQILTAELNPAKVVDRGREYAPDYFLDHAFEEVKTLVKGQQRVVTVQTTFDLDLQKRADEAILTHLRQYGQAKRVDQAALVSVEVNGAIRALVGGRDYGESQFNRATSALRQPGSSFKPYVYLTAFMNGFSPDSVVPDAPISIGHWSPKNYNRRYRGNVTLMTALVKSINTIPVRLTRSFGREKVIETAKLAGIKSQIRPDWSLPLGSSEVTVMDMASGYSSFANGGYSIPPYAVLKITESNGELIYDRADDSPPPKRIFPEDKVHQLNRVLHQVVERGTGRRAQIEGVKAAGKTGTTNAYKNAWFVGYTGNFVTAVWYGNDNEASTGRLTGGNLPAMTWQYYMRHAQTRVEPRAIPGVEDPTLPTAAVAAKSEETDPDKDVSGRQLPDRPSKRAVNVLTALVEKFGGKLRPTLGGDEEAGLGNRPSKTVTGAEVPDLSNSATKIRTRPSETRPGERSEDL